MARLLTTPDRARFRRRFVIWLCDLQQVDLYWLPSERRLMVRQPTAMKRHAIPAEAWLIGKYTHPCSPEDFLGDLEDVLAKIVSEELGRRDDAEPRAAFA